MKTLYPSNPKFMPNGMTVREARLRDEEIARGVYYAGGVKCYLSGWGPEGRDPEPAEPKQIHRTDWTSSISR